MTNDAVEYPARKAVAAENRRKILDAARAAFLDPGADVSMAEIARRSGVGMATLYRNFPGRPELVAAVYADEVDALCRAATTSGDADPGEALISWLRMVFDFLPSKRMLLGELAGRGEHSTSFASGSRAKAIDAGRPLLAAAQRSGEIRADLSMEQIFDMIVALAAINQDADYVRPMLANVLDGLRSPAV